MYFPDPEVKKDPVRRWALPDRIFFGHGACHILAGVFLESFPGTRFYPIWIRPHPGYYGNHIFVTDGTRAFDYHGFTLLVRLVAHHRRGWSRRFPGWGANTERVDFSLLDTEALNQRKMRGPDQYLYNPIPRAKRFLARYTHDEAHGT